MRTQRWLPWTTWCGLVLMGVLTAMQVEARGGGEAAAVGVVLVAVGAVAAFPAAVVPVAGASVGAVGAFLRVVGAGLTRRVFLRAVPPVVAIGNPSAPASRPAASRRVRVQGTVQGTIPGDDFATAFLAIWLGAHPPNPDLKSGLLGGACA